MKKNLSVQYLTRIAVLTALASILFLIEIPVVAFYKLDLSNLPVLLGAFSINKSVFDVGVCVAFGVFGWLMNKYEFPLSPILLAMILGPMCEKNFVRYMNIQKGNFGAIVTSPIAMAFLIVAVAVVLFSIYNQQKINKREAAAKAAAKQGK